MIDKAHLKKFLIKNNNVRVITKDINEMLECFEVMFELGYISDETLASFRGPRRSGLRTKVYLNNEKKYATWDANDAAYVLYKKEQRIVI